MFKRRGSEFLFAGIVLLVLGALSPSDSRGNCGPCLNGCAMTQPPCSESNVGCDKKPTCGACLCQRRLTESFCSCMPPM